MIKLHKLELRSETALVTLAAFCETIRDKLLPKSLDDKK